MAGSDIYIMEAANLFCGAHDPTKSKHLTLSELGLPALQESFADHNPGGSKVGIEVAVGVNKLEPTFKLAGWDPDLLGQFGISSGQRRLFTAYGVISSKRTGAKIEAKAIMEGRLGKIEAETFQRGEMQSHDYAINEVLHYELYFDGSEKIYWDFFTSEWRLDGVDNYAAERSILRIGG